MILHGGTRSCVLSGANNDYVYDDGGDDDDDDDDCSNRTYLSITYTQCRLQKPTDTSDMNE